MTLDLTPFTLFWADEFTELKLGDALPRGTNNWYTQQFWGGGFGDAAFKGAASGIFNIVSKGGSADVLEIKMRRNASNGLESGLISMLWPDGSSAANEADSRKSYYEARMWLPDPIAGIWPAFWGVEKEYLSSYTGTKHALELDVIEMYGGLPDRYTITPHTWDFAPAGNSYTRTFMAPGLGVMNTGWHTYGVEIGADGSQTYYFDREPCVFFGPKTSTWGSDYNALLNTPMGWMLNFAAGGGWPIDPELGTTKPASLFIDYFRIYKEIDTMFETDFTITPAGQDITVIPGITRAQGADGAMTINAASGVDSNTAALTGNCYLLPSTLSQAQFIQARMTAVGAAGPLIVVRATNEANWIGVRWTTTTIEIVKKISGSATLVTGGSASGLTNAIGDIIRLEIDAANNARVLVNGVEKVAPVLITAPTLTAQTCGLVPRSTVKTPWIDDLASGPL